jgi:hypothetical protein
VKRDVDEMRPEIEPETGSRSGIFAPTLTDERTEAIHVRLEVRDFAEASGLEDGFGGEDVAFPSAVLKDGEKSVLFACDPDELTGLGEVEGEGLVDNNVLACPEGGCGEREVTLIRGGNDDQIHAGVRRCFHERTDGDSGEVREYALRPAGANNNELKPRNGANKRGMKGLANVAIADKADADRGGRWIGHSCFFRVEDAARESKPRKRMTTPRGRAMLEESCFHPSDPMHIEARLPVFCYAL